MIGTAGISDTTDLIGEISITGATDLNGMAVNYDTAGLNGMHVNSDTADLIGMDVNSDTTDLIGEISITGATDLNGMAVNSDTAGLIGTTVNSDTAGLIGETNITGTVGVTTMTANFDIRDFSIPQSLGLFSEGKFVITPTLSGSFITPRAFNDVCLYIEETISHGMEVMSYFPRGFENTGNACYRNAVIQSLFSVSPLVHLISKLSINAECLSKSMYTWRELLTFADILSSKPLNSNTKKPSTSNKWIFNTPHLEGTINPDIYFASTFLEFQEKMSVFHSKTPPLDVSVVGYASQGDIHRPSQEDAMEFMTFLLERLNDEIINEMTETSQKDIDNKSTTNHPREESLSCVNQTKVDMARQPNNVSSPIIRLCYGSLRSTVTYNTSIDTTSPLSDHSITFQQISSINLNIAGDSCPMVYTKLPPLKLEDAIQLYFDPTTLDGGNIKSIQFEQLPQMLVLQLDRFYFDTNLMLPSKIEREVIYPLTLYLPDNLLSPTLMAGDTKKSKRFYSLESIICHHGVSATSGHYTALCKHSNPLTATATLPTKPTFLEALASIPGKVGNTNKSKSNTPNLHNNMWGRMFDDNKVNYINHDDATKATKSAYILLYSII